MYKGLPKRWETEQFLTPGEQYAPIYSWVWNGKCTHEETDRQLDEMERLGVRAFYIIPEPKNFRPNSIPTNLEPDYLTDEYFAEYSYAVQQAKRRGMQCWLYDEGGWPSGGACGKVLEQYPETVMLCVRCSEFSVRKGDCYQKGNPQTLGAFTNDATLIVEGHIFDKDTTVVEYYSTPEPGVNYPDITKKGTTQCFLDITHNAYKKAMGDQFKNSFTAIFTDEPKAPYTPIDALAEYERVYGYSVLPYLPILAPTLSPPLTAKISVEKEAKEVLANWYDLCSRLFCDRFLKECKKWANDHDMLFTGHMDVDHMPTGCVHGGLNYHLMRALRCLDIPGIDVIWRQIFPGEPHIYEHSVVFAENGFFPRYASSAATQNGTDYAMSESLGVYGDGVTFEEMRFCFGFQAIRGINIFNLILISYARGVQPLAQEQPSFTEKFACYKHLNVFNAYLERLSYVSSLGDRVCDTALYYPINDFWRRENEDAVSASFDALGRALEDRRIGFDIVDDDVIEGADGIERGCIRIGKACYTRIVIPSQAYLPKKTKAVLERFCAAGGTVCYTAEELPAVELVGDAEKVRMMHRVLENGDLYCFFNENEVVADFDFTVSGRNVYRISIEDGKVYVCPHSPVGVHLTLVSGETQAVLVTDEELEANEDLSECEKNVPLSVFTVSPKIGCVLKDTGCEWMDYADAPQVVTLDDWSEIVGEEYSGSCVYKTTFELEEIPSGDCILDLGKVCYTCEIALNGTTVTTKLMPPYRCVLSRELLKKTNELELTVTNTMANQFVYTNVFQNYEPWQLSPYYDKQLDFMKDSLPSGLFGPVQILCANPEKK